MAHGVLANSLIMPHDVLAPQVRNLVQEKLHTIEELRVLLCLHARAPRAFSLEELRSEVSMPASALEVALHVLVFNGLIGHEGERPELWRFHCPAETSTGAVSQLAQAYEHNTLELLTFISGNAIKRARRNAIDAFAQSVRIKYQ